MLVYIIGIYSLICIQRASAFKKHLKVLIYSFASQLFFRFQNKCTLIKDDYIKNYSEHFSDFEIFNL